MSVTAPKGFAAAGVSAGIRKSGRRDVALVRSLLPSTGAAMFTANRMQAAPVTVCKEHLELAEPQAVVANSGVANAATGEQGVLAARATAAEAAWLLGLKTEQVLVLSTGVIGAPLPVDKVLAGVRSAALQASPGGGGLAAEAIMTTDTTAKEAVARGTGFTVGGMAKGSGMIHPNLATMLAVVTTDYPLDPGEAIAFLRPAVDASFNAISVDGECSTNDTVLLLANGASGIERTPASDEQFALCLRTVCAELARQIVADGEGATVVHGAGPQITEEMERRGLEVRFVGGRRVTTPEALQVVRESFASVNAAVCAAIGADSVPLDGDEIGLLAEPTPELGLVGTAVPSSPPAVLAALAAGLVPVVTPLAVGPLNVNADEAAAALAVGLAAEKLLFLTDVPGVYHEGELLGEIRVEDAEELLAAGSFEGGIVPKLLAAVRAAKHGLVAEIGETAVLA